MSRKIAIIPARGGSKRIPHKNIKDFLGKPILAYSVQAACQTGMFDRIIVSTDDEEIARVARQYGAEVPFMRSEKNSNDYATVTDALLEVLDCLEERGDSYDSLCCILSTAPLVSTQDIIGSYRFMEDKKAPAICPVVAFSYPIWRSLKRDKDGGISMNWPEHINARSQDLPVAYHDSGSFYWADVKKLRQFGSFFMPGCLGWEVDEIRIQDIDTETDWKLAELKYKLLND